LGKEDTRVISYECWDLFACRVRVPPKPSECSKKLSRAFPSDADYITSLIIGKYNKPSMLLLLERS
jgi:hypothetical protein